jgi:hypothetical protein
MPLTPLHRQFGHAFHEPVAQTMLRVYGWQDRREVEETRKELGAVVA